MPQNQQIIGFDLAVLILLLVFLVALIIGVVVFMHKAKAPEIPTQPDAAVPQRPLFLKTFRLDNAIEIEIEEVRINTSVVNDLGHKA